MNCRVLLVFVGYGEDGWYVTINPLDCVMGRRNNHQLLSYRYMLFARYQTLEEDMYLYPAN
ncbi:MAG: hypothetical protein V2I31_08005 [Mariniphaga sp.]|nr:hypothetical protein [Mariniphaga sp.]